MWHFMPVPLDKPTGARKVLVSLRAKSCHTARYRRRMSEPDFAKAPKEYPNWGRRGATVLYAIDSLWTDEKGQDIAEYAVMLAVILVLVIGTIRLVGTNSNTVFSRVASSIQ
jgi:Flp pilus assembly pilin Flp